MGGTPLKYSAVLQTILSNIYQSHKINDEFLFITYLIFAVQLSHQSDEKLVYVLSSADLARRLMLIAKRGKWQFVVKTCR